MTTDVGESQPPSPNDQPAPQAPSRPEGGSPRYEGSSPRYEGGGGGRGGDGPRGDRDDRPRRPGGGGGGGGGRGRFGRRKVCAFCVDKIEHIDYKEPGKLRRFVSERGKIDPRRKTGTCARHQRRLTLAIKRARHLALLPYTADHLFPSW